MLTEKNINKFLHMLKMNFSFLMERLLPNVRPSSAIITDHRNKLTQTKLSSEQGICKWLFVKLEGLIPKKVKT